MNEETKMSKISKLSLASYVALGLAVGGYAPVALAVKVVRDPNVSGLTAPPKVAPAAPAPAPTLPKMTAAQIVDKNVAARGGLAKWKAVQSMTLSGKMDAGGKVDTMLPYTVQMKRPNKQRLAIEFAGQTSLQVFDGQKGWKLRPYLNRADPEPFSADELSKTQEGPGLDGQLIDYSAKGNKVELEGTETVEGKATYRLKVTNKQGHANHVWIDGTTFLEAKIEGQPHRFDGKMRPVETYYSDYKAVDGVMIPHLSETRVQGVRATHKMTVETVALNTKLDDTLFAKPSPAVLPPQKVFTVAATTGAPTPNASPAAAATPKSTSAPKSTAR
jgi:outer membrane lipoprotein-sorting protein